MNYKKVIEDTKNEIIDPNAVLVFDNDCGYWHNPTIDDDNQEEWNILNEEHTKKYGSPKDYADCVDV